MKASELGKVRDDVRVVDVNLLKMPLSKEARQEIEWYIEACSFNAGEKSGAALAVVLERLDRLAALV